MTTPEEEEREERKKALADLKKRLEEKVSELQNEANLLKEAISIVDNELAKLSFSSGAEILQSKKIEQKEKGVEKMQFSYKGKSYGVAFVSADELTIELDPSLNLSSSTRPFETFFINRLLEGMREADTQSASKGAIRPDQILSYEVVQDGPYIRKIVVKNFRERQRIREILNGLGWTIENMLRNISSNP